MTWVVVNTTSEGEIPFAKVRCVVCGGQTKLHKEPENAAKAWNIRKSTCLKSKTSTIKTTQEYPEEQGIISILFMVPELRNEKYIPKWQEFKGEIGRTVFREMTHMFETGENVTLESLGKRLSFREMAFLVDGIQVPFSMGEAEELLKSAVGMVRSRQYEE